MFELWVNQAVHLSVGQAVTLIALSVALIVSLFFVNARTEE